VDMDGSLDVTDIIQIAYHIIDPDNNPFESQQVGIADSNGLLSGSII
jgi:hypothetical protein